MPPKRTRAKRPAAKHGLTAAQMGPRLSEKEKEARRRRSNKIRKEQIYYGNKERKNMRP